MFNTLPAALNLVFFILLGGLIWVAGTRLSYFIDAIAEQTKIARAFLGLILLATVTELPEFVTTLTASSGGNGSLALNNMYGGMMLQLAVLVIADLFVRKHTLSSQTHDPTVVVAGLLCITALSAILVFHIVGDAAVAAHLGFGSLSLAVLYIGAMYLLQHIQRRKTWSPVDLPDEPEARQARNNRFDQKSLFYLTGFSALCALTILICGVLVVRLAETLGEQTGLGTSFIGASLLALTTSMPELSTSVAAVRVKAYTMAISNIFGSNMIMTFLLFPNDLAYTEGPILDEMDAVATFALAAGVFMTAIYCIGILVRSRRSVFGLGIDSLVIALCYFISLGAMYSLR